MISKTKFLTGRLEIKNDGGNIYVHHFKIPTFKTTGLDAKKNILETAGCFSNLRCVKHLTSWFVSWRAEQCEEFCFRSPKFPDIKYDIYLTEDDYPSAVSFWGEQQARFSSFLKKVKKNKYEAIAFYFCDAVGKLINAVSKETELRYLLLNNGSPDCDFPVFQEIGHLEQLRGLWLHGFPWIKLDQAAVKELCKLKALEALRVAASFQISVEALRELGTLKTLKALHLELQENLFWEDIRHDPSLPDTEPRRGASLHRSGIPFLPDCPVENERRSTLISALASLQRLENLEILTLDVSPRLSPNELALPPNLKYLEINNSTSKKGFDNDCKID